MINTLLSNACYGPFVSYELEARTYMIVAHLIATLLTSGASCTNCGDGRRAFKPSEPSEPSEIFTYYCRLE